MQNRVPLVVHLARYLDGRESFQAFLASYRACEAGVDHDFLVLFKGFADTNDKSLSNWRSDMAGISHHYLETEDSGFDIGTYAKVAAQNAHRPVIFLNSHSVICVPGWLELYMRNYSLNTILGATGSWESPASCYLSGPPRDMVFLKKLAWCLFARFQSWRSLTVAAPFPNPHLRTNAFMVPSDFWGKLKLPYIRSKRQAMACESGYNGISRQALKLGYDLLVVDSLGKTHAASSWKESLTFRNGNQERLIVQDNRTRQYATASEAERQRLARLAWGRK